MRMPRSTVLLLAAALCAVSGRTARGKAPKPLPDIRSVRPDLQVPPMVTGKPAPGKRVRRVAPEYRGTQVYHTLYLPADWRAGRRYPVIVEYAGNGPYRNRYGDVSTGVVEGSKLGYGLSGGRGFIWLCLPYVNSKQKINQRQWWGDAGATVEYCKLAVRRVCEDYGGDSSAVFLAGFSRGAIACGYLGLHDDEIADIWLAFIPYSHYDGVRRWGYAGSDRASAIERLGRIRGRASFICHEGSVADTKRYVEASGVGAAFTFRAIPFRNHNDGWALRDIPTRRAARAWIRRVLADRPGTHTVHGRVTGVAGRGVAGVRIRTGPTHWTLTDAAGRYELAGLIDGPRKVTAAKKGLTFTPAHRAVTLRGKNLDAIDFTAAKPQADPSGAKPQADPSGAKP